ncbi:hypothetical protein [Pseudomonas yamanorum]|uniref:hypothetical protein n=1 Tax=Pseudomonas yamanorum TaxID=515393 RepID=UPI000879C1E4|nr:hypothetical protein [Pseudomonas yamanorum]SDU32515.1 hypothetical protein SAMN05216237_4288 [Pseudomonas yamanorum]
MDDRIEAAIFKLKANAGGVVFTGFVSNAEIKSPAMLTGEVWSHVLADGFGGFADGHRIETSDIVQIHARGDSLWITTQSGSDYGILSFTPLGWRYLADLYQADRRLDPQSPGTPVFHMQSPTVETFGLVKKRCEENKLKFAPLSRKARKHELLGPEGDTKYLKRMEAFVQDTIETLERNGVTTFRTEE